MIISFSVGEEIKGDSEVSESIWNYIREVEVGEHFPKKTFIIITSLEIADSIAKQPKWTVASLHSPFGEVVHDDNFTWIGMLGDKSIWSDSRLPPDGRTVWITNTWGEWEAHWVSQLLEII